MIIYQNLGDFSALELSEAVRTDTRKTSYKSKDLLADKIEQAASKGLKGLVALNEENLPCGFILYRGEELNNWTVTDMFTCKHFIGKGFFMQILSHMKEQGYAKPNIDVDDNAANMPQFMTQYGTDLVWN